MRAAFREFECLTVQFIADCDECHKKFITLESRVDPISGLKTTFQSLHCISIQWNFYTWCKQITDCCLICAIPTALLSTETSNARIHFKWFIPTMKVVTLNVARCEHAIPCWDWRGRINTNPIRCLPVFLRLKHKHKYKQMSIFHTPFELNIYIRKQYSAHCMERGEVFVHQNPYIQHTHWIRTEHTTKNRYSKSQT